MKLFEINGEDFTHRIMMTTYAVNRKPRYNEWEDENGTKHRDNYAYKVQGSFKMYFDSIEDYLHFVEVLNEQTTAGGVTPVVLYVNNTNSVRETNVFIDFEPQNDMPYFGVTEHDGFTINLEEA